MGDPCLDQEDQEYPEADMAGQSDLKQKKRILGEELEMTKQACQTQNVIDNHGNLIDFRTIEEDAQEDEETWIQDLKKFYSGLKIACGKDEFLLKRLAPLHKCVVFILLDLRECPRLLNFLHPIHGPIVTTFDSFGFLRSAAEYQMIFKDVSYQLLFH